MKSVTIAIPSYNEEGNIYSLLETLLKQKQSSYVLERIIVLLDGSTDNTRHIVEKFTKNNKLIKLITNKKRKGKIYRLNQAYSINTSDYLVTLDADILPEDEYTIERFVNNIQTEKADIAAANLVPVKPNTFIGKIIYTNNIMWKNVGMQFKNGDHISNLYGQANILKKDFAKSFKYPLNISCDEEYLYIKACQANGFRFAKDVKFYFKSPESFHDYIFQSRRFLKERDSLVPYFGRKILNLHEVPFNFKFKAVLSEMKVSPFYTILAILLNLVIKIIPLNDSANKMGQWVIAESTKSFGI